MKNFITLFFLMMSIQCFAQPTVNFENGRSLNEINDGNLADAYPWISPDGLRIYYTKEFSDRQELVYTERKDYQSDFSAPVIVPTGDIIPTSCWLSENELTAYVTDIYDLYFCRRTSRTSEFETPIKINLEGAPSYSFLSGASLDGSQNELIISLKESSGEHCKMAKFKRNSNFSFSFEKYIVLPLGLIPELGQFSKDGLSLCFSIKDKDGLAKFYSLARTHIQENFDLNSFNEMNGLNKYVGLIGQPSISSNMEWFVAVSNTGGFWQQNDLFIAQREFFTGFDKQFQPLNLKVYPNPTSGKVYIACGMSNVRIEIFSVLGQQIDRFISSSALVNYEIEEEGVYLIRVFTEDGVQSQKLIVSHL